MARAWIGTSGYNYPHWRGDFYPEEVPSKRWLPFYADRFDIVEINYSFYQLPARRTFLNWAVQTPEGFRFVIKGSRFITHIRRLEDCRGHIQRLMDASRPIWPRMSAVLWQLPARLPAAPDRLERFLSDLEETRGPERLRHAFEFRERSWFSPRIYDILEQHDAAVVFADLPFQVLAKGQRHRDGGEIVVAPETASWTYIRRHGDAIHSGDYPEASLEADARWVRKRLRSECDTYVFYNNDVGGYAPRNATSLQRLVESAMPAGRERRRRGVRRPVGLAAGLVAPRNVP